MPTLGKATTGGLYISDEGILCDGHLSVTIFFNQIHHTIVADLKL